MTVKKPAPTIPVPNPLDNFASYTYGLSLWWLDLEDADDLAQCTDVDTALAQTLPNSYVLAEDSGLYPNQRIPGSGGLNYYLQDLEIMTMIGSNTLTAQTNDLGGKFKILEPYGVTFLNVLASYAATKPNNDYVSQTYLLQIDFFGYDDAGNQIPVNQTEIYRKRFPIHITSIKMHVGSGGAEYNCQFTPAGHVPYKEMHCKLPKAITVTASTFGELLNNVANEYNQYYLDEVKRESRALADTLKFDIDPDIASSSVVDPKTAPLSAGNQSAIDVDLTKQSFTFTYGEDINTVIQKAFAQCKFFADDQLGAGIYSYTSYQPSNDGVIVNTYKTVSQILHKGIDGSGGIHLGYDSYDKMRCFPAYESTFKIHQYATWGGTHSQDPSALADTRPYTCKLYNYTYTGENTQVLGIKADFNLAFYTAVLAYSTISSAAQVTADSSVQNLGEDAGAGYGWSSNFIATTVAPQLQNTPLLGKVRVQPKLQNMSLINGLGGRQAAITALDVLKSKQQFNADMLVIDIDIVGDPTLIKQDDWLYAPSPTQSAIYNSWDSMSQYDFAVAYGHMRMDSGQLNAGLQINTPLDIDVDYGQTGLMYPELQRNGTVTSLFSGQYKITKVVNKFSKGVFNQTVTLSRILGSELLNQTAPSANSASSISQTNQRESTSTNGSPTSPTASLPVTNLVNTATNSTGPLLGTNLNGQATLIPGTLQLTTNAGLSVNNTNGVGVQARQ